MINKYLRGQSDTRPWGTWEVIDCGKGFCVKRIRVVPGGILSLQSHQYRSENWVVVAGAATVTIGEKTCVKKVGDNVYIPVQTKHRIQNDSLYPLEFIEIQVGENLDENDIIRYDDRYGRI